MRNSEANPHSRDGFTLIELAIVLAISTIIFVGAYELHSRILDFGRFTQDDLNAQLSANRLLWLWRGDAHVKCS